MRLLVVLAEKAAQNQEIIQFDIATAFLNSERKEEISMDQPEGFEVGDRQNLVYALLKGLYELKQASKQETSGRNSKKWDSSHWTMTHACTERKQTGVLSSGSFMLMTG
jgi:hypothetical protein